MGVRLNMHLKITTTFQLVYKPELALNLFEGDGHNEANYNTVV